MNRCHECGEAFLGGALFCGECGAYLVPQASSLETLHAPLHAAVNSEVASRPLDYRLGFGIKADKIIFVIPSSGRQLAMDLGDSISIGRQDNGLGIWPELDLTLEKGAERGVSRRHAMVRSSDEGVVLVDLGSTNGTRINDQKLPPESPHLLKDGDMVRFGKLLVRIYFQ